jgi:hypothetical protein
MSTKRKWIIALLLGVPLTICGGFLGTMEIIRYSLGTIEYHFNPKLDGNVFVLSPTDQLEPPPGHYNYNFNENVIIQKAPLRRSAGRITGFIGTNRYPNVCYPKGEDVNQFGVWLSSPFTMKTMPGYEIWTFHVGRAGDAMKLPNAAEITNIQAKIRSSSNH